MPDPCDALEHAYHTAFNADRAADLSFESAENNLLAAELSEAAAVLSMIACGLTIETGPGFIACEAAAFAAAEAAAVWIESAAQGLAAATITAALTEDAMDDALADWCACVNQPH